MYEEEVEIVEARGSWREVLKKSLTAEPHPACEVLHLNTPGKH